MSLRLAPYNDAMRLGQGFNSYTHELCIDGAVDVRQHTVNQDSRGGPPNPSQVVSYSARCVEKLSDIVEAMNLSYSSSIKKGTIEIGGNSTTVDENTFKLSDLNVVVSVRVVNQTISVQDGSTFVPFSNQEATAARFNEIYGDSYVSGFIEGGDFSGIVSIKVIDRSDVNNTVNAIKTSLISTSNNKKSTDATDFTLGPSVPPEDKITSTELSAALKDTETTISINWMGGGQIKEPAQPWDIDSLYAAAAAFPASVAQCPQRTWAILTPYKANRSFISWSMQSPVKTLQYDLIASYTAELFDRFMDYKLLLKRAQHVLSNRRLYRQRIGVANAIGTEVATLLCLRAALRNEQTKIVEAIEVLAKDPSVLKRHAAWTNGHQSEVVRRIVEKALGEFKDWHPDMTSTDPRKETIPEAVPAEHFPSTEVSTPPATAGLDVTIPEAMERNEVAEEGGQLPGAEEAGSEEARSSTEERDEKDTVNPPSSPSHPDNPAFLEPAKDQGHTGADTATNDVAESTDFNFDTLIAPEVWEDLLPEPLEPITGPLTITAPVTSIGPLVGPGIGGITSFTLTAPPPDSETGPGSLIITSESYAKMEEDLKSAKADLANMLLELNTLKTTHSALQASQAALEQTAKLATERAATFEQQAKKAVADLQTAQRTIDDVNTQFLAFKASTATRISALDSSLATETGRVENLSNERLREQNAREDLQRRIDNFKGWWEGPLEQFKDSPTGHPFMNGLVVVAKVDQALLPDFKIPLKREVEKLWA